MIEVIPSFSLDICFRPELVAALNRVTPPVYVCRIVRRIGHKNPLERPERYVSVHVSVEAFVRPPPPPLQHLFRSLPPQRLTAKFHTDYRMLWLHKLPTSVHLDYRLCEFAANTFVLMETLFVAVSCFLPVSHNIGGNKLHKTELNITNLITGSTNVMLILILEQFKPFLMWRYSSAVRVVRFLDHTQTVSWHSQTAHIQYGTLQMRLFMADN